MSSSYGAKKKAKSVYRSATIIYPELFENKIFINSIFGACKVGNILDKLLITYKKTYDGLKTDKQKLDFVKQLRLEIEDRI